MAKPATRTKAPALPVPQTRADAEALAANFAAVQREAELLAMCDEEEIAKIKERGRLRIDPMVARANDMAAALIAYVESNRADLFKDARTTRLGCAELTLRWSGPTVTVARSVKEAQMVATLKGLGLTGLVRIEETVNKQAILANPDQVESVAGITITQTERLHVKLEGVTKPIQSEFQRVTGSAARNQAEE
ncbi:MAG: host-nuclease inhibitor Gam family protein [Alphaproteobacteria bacterium]|nr:host-nuclease inhibitor Gam family protein [Alphaproteobacteria bacterium]